MRRMNKSRYAVILSVSLFVMVSALLLFCVEHTEAAEKVLLLRRAKEEHAAAAAVEAYLTDDMLDVKVSVRIERARPRIDNVILVGTKIGRISPVSIAQIFATTEEEAPYETDKRGGLIDFGGNTNIKQPKGMVVRKMYQIKVPKEKIVEDGTYEIWVRVKQDSANGKGRVTSFKFDLDKLPECIKK